MTHIIELKGGVARNPLVRLKKPIDIEIGQGEHIAIIGPNGAGKSILVDTLLGKYPLKEGKLSYDFSPSVSQTIYDNVKYITFRDTYGSADANYYYQQRWNSTDQEDAPTVREQLGTVDNEQLCQYFFRLFHMESLLDKKIILLSSGELRKFQLIKALITAPRVLIIDNPFIGLDVDARHSLNMLLDELSTLEHLQIILVLSATSVMPSFITHIVPVHQGLVGAKVELDVYLSTHNEASRETPTKNLHENPIKHDSVPATEVVRLNKVNIRYGDRTILKDLDWTIRRGEKWALCGDNGSGKSTLLSLICADNPQSYACDISLFGRKRGTGESIWDIKKRIGYVSPEMHRAYLKNIPAIEIVASGLHDSIGLYKRPSTDDLVTCEAWMERFNIAELKDKPFLQLSSGEQRLALLARAFVKDPELLILDEPFHGLDPANRNRVKEIIENYCTRPGTTLIMVTHYEEELPKSISHYLRLKKNVER
ncbi:ATP-binding cassette domain-containing protein [Bacteroides sp. 51]|uniref:ATP-binding cassette domain-containing protein n=1 Tax=Bacteroides sp. 51 TaxID=2302938 RepID=UPI0013D067A9|nr:ATP-binding cassette domain-containing protein [Bacteroides sp. 51]NDV81930.1 ATP-binding cassette domain-containing protein [Bacteroides sp. 51]